MCVKPELSTSTRFTEDEATVLVRFRFHSLRIPMEMEERNAAPEVFKEPNTYGEETATLQKVFRQPDVSRNALRFTVVLSSFSFLP